MTLAAGKPGDEFQIRRIISPTIRDYFRDLDLVEGDRARLEAAGTAYLRVRTSRERVVLVERYRACCVEVTPVDDRETPARSPETPRAAAQPRRRGPCWCNAPAAPDARRSSSRT